MKWFPLCNYTHYSLQRAFSKPKQLAKKCSENSYRACGIADYKSISGAVSFYQACIANDIKPIIGCAFDGFTLFAKNKEGWLELIRIVSTLDDRGNVDTGLLVKLANQGNLICLARDPSVSPISGEDFYQKSSAFPNTYYVERDQAELHRVLICGHLKKTMSQVKRMIRNNTDIADYQIFFECSEFYIKDKMEAAQILVDDPKMDIFDEIFDKCENYNILSKPMLPKFPCPIGYSEGEYLVKLCKEGWLELEKDGTITSDNCVEYRARYDRELKVIENANLSGYFLIVWDILKFCRDNGWMVGPGRGSAAGCLISYLMQITMIDPIEFNLLFERFYNDGRNTEDHVSLPDIDMDVPTGKRDAIIQELKERYGAENVSQMCTFGRLQGRSAIKEVLRVNQACGFGEMNYITKYIPDEAAISDQLAMMDEEDRSIIRWALLNNADDLRDYCHIDDDGELRGDYSEYFQQAIDMEGTFKTQGKHAAGVVISAQPLHEVCPMVNQKSGGEKIAGLEMNDLEALGHVKFDVLGINLLDKLMYVKELI
jgi:DNA polymerase-3 subunit alpha